MEASSGSERFMYKIGTVQHVAQLERTPGIVRCINTQSVHVQGDEQPQEASRAPCIFRSRGQADIEVAR